MKNQIIKSLKGREILDSRGNPTVEVELETNSGRFLASVPSGASKGKYEALELRDGGKRYFGKGVLKAIKNINEIIAPRLKGKRIKEQKEVDEFLINLDGTENKSRLGANAILPVSLAICRAGAKLRKLPLYLYIKEISGNKKIFLPKPCFNIINGGAHAKNNLDIQEFMIVPQFENFSENFKKAKKIYKKLFQIIKEKYKKFEMGDEGGFSPPISRAVEALELIKEASLNFKDTKIILDCAATQFQKGKKYKIEGTLLSKKEVLIFYQSLILKYPILGIEDPFGEEDLEGWKMISSKFQTKNLLIIGDDLLVTNPKRMRMAKKKNLCNGTIIKINQIGTVWEAIEAANLAKSFGWKLIVSHRSGETNDDFISDFAVGIGADFIKAGAPAKKERLAKYKRLLKIEEELKNEKNHSHYY